MGHQSLQDKILNPVEVLKLTKWDIATDLDLLNALITGFLIEIEGCGWYKLGNNELQFSVTKTAKFTPVASLFVGAFKPYANRVIKVWETVPWYKALPAEGALCKVSAYHVEELTGMDNPKLTKIAVITSYDSNTEGHNFYSSLNDVWHTAIPLTDEELNAFKIGI